MGSDHDKSIDLLSRNIIAALPRGEGMPLQPKHAATLSCPSGAVVEFYLRATTSPVKF